MECLNLYPVERDDEVMWVPCGKCIPCLVNKRSDWSMRLMEEYKSSHGAAFVTLTYSERFVPSDGVSKRHVQLFLKRLRKRIGTKIRYYAVAEYGSKTGRPHYHMLLFNVTVEDVEVVRKAWTLRDRKSGKEVPIGIVHIGGVTEASVMYTTKYIVQKGVSCGANAPFALMSRAYGLGASYLSDDVIAWHRGSRSPRRVFSRFARCYRIVHGVKYRLPRYYKDKIWPLVKGSQWERVRRNLSKLLFKSGQEARCENVRVIRLAGYSDPDAIIAEMRKAVMSRVRQKIAFTQTM